MTNISLTEGLGSIVKNMATGNMEKEIAELEQESKDIHTPEQQRIVITKVVRLLEKLVQIRHAPTMLQTYVHDSVAWFQRVTGKKEAGKEMSLRTGEAIRRLSTLRDKILAKKWNDEKYNKEVDALKARAKELIDKASTTQGEY